MKHLNSCKGQKKIGDVSEFPLLLFDSAAGGQKTQHRGSAGNHSTGCRNKSGEGVIKRKERSGLLFNSLIGLKALKNTNKKTQNNPQKTLVKNDIQLNESKCSVFKD